MTEWSKTTKRIPDNLFHRVCDKDRNENVEGLLELGADPFSEDDQGVAAVTKAVLSRVEPLQKLRSFKKFYTDKVKTQLYKKVSFIRYVKMHNIFMNKQLIVLIYINIFHS